jgi:hypothetical protein
MEEGGKKGAEGKRINNSYFRNRLLLIPGTCDRLARVDAGRGV